MEELKKISNVLKKIDEAAPHETLLVLDATTGQNANSQVKQFNNFIDITGIIITKLDGTAKAGVVVAISQNYGLPIFAVGVGEDVNDLQPFNTELFVNNLITL
jgi:fused signal recognition particle receptor